MKREDFVFSIGFQGNTAIVDGRARKRYGTLSFRELAEKGLYKAAYCSVMYSGVEADLEEFIALFNRSVQGRTYGKDELARLFGVYGVPDGITRIKIID